MKKHLVILFLFFLSSKLTAQEPIRYTTKQGLPTNHVYDIAEDENGFMWFATKQGVVKYDGETFKTFTIKDGLPNNDTWLLEADLQGRLWYFSKSQYQGYIKNDSIYTFSTKRKEVISPRFTYKTKDGLWFYGSSGMQTFSNSHIIDAGLFSLMTREVFNKKLLDIQQQNGFGIDKVMPGLLNPETKEYIFFQKEKLQVYDWNLNFKRELTIDIPLRYILKNRKIDNNGLLYNQIGFYALGKGILFIDFKTYETYYKSFKELVGVEETNYFRCIGTKNEIQISIPGHLMIFDYNLNLKNTYIFPEYLSKNSFKDSKDNIWLTDLANGISLIPNTQNITNYYLQNQKVQKINVLDNNLIAGVNDVGFFKLDNLQNSFVQLNKFIKVNAEIYQLKNNNVNYLLSASESYVLNNSVLEPLFPKYTENNGGYIVGSKDIVLFNDSFYFVNSGLILKSKLPQENTEIVTNKTGLLFAEVFNKNLYFAGSDGLHKMVNDSLVKPKIKNNLLNVSVSSVLSTSNYLIVGTDGRGVYFYKNNALYQLKNTNGLSVQRIIQKENTLWLATQKGVKKITLNTLNLENSKITNAFYEADGLLQNNTNDIYLQDDFLYAASDIGLAKLNLSNPIYSQKPKLYFTKQQDTLIFKNGERNNISVSFSALDFVNQEHLMYEYRLLPKLKNWITTTTKTLNFLNLSHGVYTLEVKVTDQHRNESIIKQYINVIPEWWQTTLARIGFLIILLFLFIILNKVIIQIIKKKAQEKMLQEKRVSGLELQALRSQMNPHFVHNSLNAIQYFIQRNEVELSENYLSKFSQLIRLFFEYSRRQTVTINEELDLLTNYLDIEKLRFEEKLNYTISVCDKIDVDEQLIPSMLLQPIIENAVNHGIFHKKEDGLVKVSFKQLDNDTFQVIIEDDGIGINKAKAIFKASSKNYQSNSSAVLLERIDLLNHSKEWHVKYEIKDRSEIENNKTGTLVNLTFKQIH